MKDISEFKFQKNDPERSLEPLKISWRESLTYPQDGMWESLTNESNHWSINFDNQTIGYACVDDDGCMLQFFVLPFWLDKGRDIFKKFVTENNVTSALVGTNNPVFLSLIVHFQKSVEVHTYLFTDVIETSVPEKAPLLKVSEKEDLSRIVDFCHSSMGAPKDWLTGYISDLIETGEVFLLLKNETSIIGTCEVRKSHTNPEVADLGMIISLDYRGEGWGTYLLGKAKEIATQWNRKPICSCEKENIGSLKCIQNNGFRSYHQMLACKL